MPDKPTIGLTGGIASGKSSVARVLRELGVAVVDADQLAREVVAPGSDGLREVVAAFGSEVLDADGGLDREKMGKLVFVDPDKRKQLQAITHPRIGRLSAERLQAAHASDAPYVVYEAPLLVEVGAHKGMDAVIVVAATAEAQVERTRTRDGLGESEARARIDAQLPLADKIAVADYVIHNDGSLEDLEARARRAHGEIIERFGLGARP